MIHSLLDDLLAVSIDLGMIAVMLGFALIWERVESALNKRAKK